MPGPIVLQKQQPIAWPAHTRSLPQRLAFALVCVAVATGLRLSLDPVLGIAIPWMFYFPAVVVASWFGRLGGGLLATTLSLVVVSYFWILPEHSLLPRGTEAWISVAGFSSSAIVISLLAEFWHRSAVAELKARNDLELERTFLNRTLSSITDGFVVFDPEWRYIYINEVAVKLARKPRDELIGKKVWDVFPDLRGSEFERQMLLSRHENKPVQFEMHYTPFDLWVEVRAYPMNESTAIYVADISPRKQTELALARAQEQLAQHAADLERTVAERTAKLQETIAELERFSYTISHDLRAPLRAMESFSTFVAEDYADKLDQTGLDYLNRIRDAARRMDRLISDVLVYSKASRAELKLEPVDLDRLARDIVSEYSTLRPSEPHIEIQSPLGHVVGNVTLLTQSLSNLLRNAVKFVKPGESPEIRLWTEQRNHHLRLFIRDQGIGIPAVADEQAQVVVALF